MLDIDVYEPSGEWLEVLDEGDRKVVRRYEALFMVRPRETDGTRIGRQPDVPGPVIQDPGDGQRASILKWRVAAGEMVSFDVGQFGSAAEFHAAVVETMETRGVWTGVWTPGPGALADGSDDCDALAFCQPPDSGPPGGFSPWGEPTTFIDRYILTKDLDAGDGDMELQLTMWFQHPKTGRKAALNIWENYDVEEDEAYERDPSDPEYDFLLWMLHHDSPVPFGWPAFVHAVELDPGGILNQDDELGTRDLGPRDNGEMMIFVHDKDKKPALELTLSWGAEDEDSDDDDEGRDRGGSG